MCKRNTKQYVRIAASETEINVLNIEPRNHKLSLVVQCMCWEVDDNTITAPKLPGDGAVSAR